MAIHFNPTVKSPTDVTGTVAKAPTESTGTMASSTPLFPASSSCSPSSPCSGGNFNVIS